MKYKNRSRALKYIALMLALLTMLSAVTAILFIATDSRTVLASIPIYNSIHNEKSGLGNVRELSVADSTNINTATQKGNEAVVSIRYRADDELVKMHDFSYSDTYFDSDNTDYNSPLAQISLGLSISAFSTVESNKDYNASRLCGREAYLKKAYDDLGFENAKFFNYDKPLNSTENSVGFAIAEKALQHGNHKGSTLVNVTLRGAGYGAEWASNVEANNSGNHYGFNEAAKEVIQETSAYIEGLKNNGKDKIILWISGYSRGGAVGILTAHYLNGSDLLEPENIYVYTFAAPNCTRNNTEASLDIDKNIFNISSPLDVVPLLPFESWGYGKYGNNLTLPVKQADGDTEPNKYSNIYSENGRIKTVYNNFENLITNIFPSVEAYADASITDILGASAKKLNINLTFRLLSSVAFFNMSFQDIVKGYIDKAFDSYTSRQSDSDIDASGKEIEIFTEILKAFYFHSMDEQIDTLKNSSECLKAHMPDHYLRWMDEGAI